MPKEARGALPLNFRWITLCVAAILGTAPLVAGPPANASALSFIQIDVPGAMSTAASGINDAGQIVGSINFGSHGFIDSGGSFTQIDVPGANFTQANGVNDAGQIVGLFIDATGRLRGFLDTGGVFTQIDVPGSESTFPFGINDAGQIVGFFSPIFLMPSTAFSTAAAASPKSTRPAHSIRTPSASTTRGRLRGRSSELPPWRAASWRWRRRFRC